MHGDERQIAATSSRQPLAAVPDVTNAAARSASNPFNRVCTRVGADGDEIASSAQSQQPRGRRCDLEMGRPNRTQSAASQDSSLRILLPPSPSAVRAAASQPLQLCKLAPVPWAEGRTHAQHRGQMARVRAPLRGAIEHVRPRRSGLVRRGGRGGSNGDGGSSADYGGGGDGNGDGGGGSGDSGGGGTGGGDGDGDGDDGCGCGAGSAECGGGGSDLHGTRWM
eukprot:5673284-Pleurochrysis_carterae.AAC.1